LTHWRYAGATDTGLVRQSNQDAIYVDDQLAMVADGMGGHAAGEVASAMAIEIIRDEFEVKPTVEGLYNAINTANREVLHDAGGNPEHFGMGTTVIAIGLTRDADGMTSPTLFHVGDSRAYQLRDGALRQLSEDHSVAEEWVRMGRLTPEEAAVHPRRHQLTRGIGVEETIAIDVLSLHAEPGDRILLCSDGLSNELDNDTLARLSSAPFTLDEAVTQLVESARQSGGRDNISALLIEFDEVNVAAVPIKKTVTSNPPPIAPSLNSSATRMRRQRRLTWRVWLAFLFIAVVAAGFVAIVHWYAYSSFYLANDAGTIAVYRGQPSGVFWYKPVKIEDTQYKFNQLRAADRQALAATISEPTLQAALQGADYLHSQFCLYHSCTTGATTTTTVAGTPTTVGRPTTTVHTTTTTLKKG
jgi:serine/threonine protein phosphatase PrpC